MMISIKAKILLTKLITVVVTVLLLGSLGYRLMVTSLQEVQQEKLEFVARTTARELDRYLQDLQEMLERMESVEYFRKNGELQLAQHFSQYQEYFPVLIYLDREGREELKLVRGEVATSLREWGKTDLFRQAMSRPNRAVLSPAAMSPELKEPVIHLALTRVLYFGDEFAGTIVAEVPLSALARLLKETAIGKTGFLSLVSRDGRTLAHPDPGRVLQPASADTPKDRKVLEDFQTRRKGFARTSLLGTDSFIAFVPLRSFEWEVVASLPHREFMIPPNQLKLLSLGLLGLILSVGLFFSLLFARGLTGSIRKLILHTEHVSAGDFTQPIVISSGDELEILAKAFNTMTERLRRATSAQESLHNILQSILDPLVVADGDGRITGVNPSAEKLFGYSEKQLNKMPITGLFAEGEPLFQGRGFQRVLESGPIRNYETQVLTREGKMVQVLFSCSLNSREEDGRCGMVGIIKDISDRREAEIARMHALREAEEARDKIDAILKSVADGLLVTDIDGRMVLMNPAAEDLLGISMVEAWQHPVATVVREKGLRDHLLAQLENDAPSPPLDLEIFDHGRQEMRVFQARTSTVESRDHLITGLITILRDATHERQVDRLKNEFISTAAHELRTPLTSIMGYSEFLMYPEEFGGFDTEQQREFLAEIFEKAEVLSKIVNELLDISRIESGQAMPLDRSRFPVEETITRVVRTFQLHCPKNRFELDLSVPPTDVWVDQGKLVQVLENLLSNAVKYSPEGGPVRVSSRLTGDRIRIVVEDRGIGMTEEQAARVFDKFYRADSSNTAIGGLGLGMSIVKTIIAAHGGNIWVESALGQGTTVTFTLPLGSDLNFAREEEPETAPLSLRA